MEIILFTWTFFFSLLLLSSYVSHLQKELSSIFTCIEILLCTLFLVICRPEVHWMCCCFYLQLDKWVVLVLGVMNNSFISVSIWRIHLSYICIWTYNITKYLEVHYPHTHRHDAISLKTRKYTHLRFKWHLQQWPIFHVYSL